jgi:nucleoside-diphosphate-sugar epimerase
MVKINNNIKTVLVTGGSGFIGSHVIDNLISRNIKVGIFDREKNNKYKNPNIKIHFGDIRDYNSISEAISKYDGVIHLAGMLGTQETVNEPIPAIQTNIIGGINVLQSCRSYEKKGVYIAVGNHWMNNPYSISKTTTERFTLMFNKEHKTKIAVVRGMNAYGERQKHKPVRKIMPNFILPALEGKPIIVYGNGNQRMDMIYVKDLADILIRALIVEHDVYNTVFSGGTGIAPTVNHIAETVIQETNSSSELRHIEMRPGESKESIVIAEPKTLIPLFDKIPKFTTLKKGVENTVKYYKEEYEK